MKRLLCMIASVATCFACSLTAFAGGPITEEDMLSAQSMDNIAEPLASSSDLHVGSVYRLRSKGSSASFMLNVPGGKDVYNPKLDMWEEDPEEKNDQNFRLVASGVYYKLIAECSESGKVLDAYRPLKNGCSVDLWYEDDNPAQQLEIKKIGSSGYSVFLASDKTLALTAVSVSKGGAVQFQTYTGASNQLWDFVPQGSTVSLPRTPDPDAQNKSNWCWAAAAKMVAEHNVGLKSSISRSSQRLTDEAGVRKGFYGIDSSGHLTADGVQHAIVKAVKGSDKNLGAGTEDTKSALRFATGQANLKTERIGNEGSALTAEDLANIREEFRYGRYVVGTTRNAGNTAGHAVAILGYRDSDKSYLIFDPWDQTKLYYQSDNIFKYYKFTSGGIDYRIEFYTTCQSAN